MSHATNNDLIRLVKDTKDDCKYDVRTAIDLLANLESCNRIPSDFKEGIEAIISNAYSALEAL
jgi:hypothetical protein